MINLETQLYNRANPQASAVLAMLSEYGIPETDRYPAGDQLDCAPFINGRERGYLLFDWRTGLNVVLFEVRNGDTLCVGHCSRNPDRHDSAITQDQFMDYWDTQVLPNSDPHSWFKQFRHGQIWEAADYIHDLFASEIASIDPQMDDEFFSAQIAPSPFGG